MGKFFILGIYVNNPFIVFYGPRGTTVKMKHDPTFFTCHGYVPCTESEANNEGNETLFSLDQGKFILFKPHQKGSLFNTYQYFSSITEKIAITLNLAPMSLYDHDTIPNEPYLTRPTIVYVFERDNIYYFQKKTDANCLELSTVEELYIFIKGSNADVILTYGFNKPFDMKKIFRTSQCLGRLFIDLFKVAARLGGSIEDYTKHNDICTIQDVIDFETKYQVFERLTTVCRLMNVSPANVRDDGPAELCRRFMKKVMWSKNIAWPPAKVKSRYYRGDEEKKPLTGGYLYEDLKPGLYTDKTIAIVDFTAMYSSIISTYNVCFSTKTVDPDTGQISFHNRIRGFLPELVDSLMNARFRATNLYEREELKRICSMIYGITGMNEDVYEFASHDIAQFITSTGQGIIKRVILTLKDELGCEIIFSHTDSVAFQIGENTIDILTKKYTANSPNESTENLEFLNKIKDGKGITDEECIQHILSSEINNSSYLRDKPKLRMRLQTLTPKLLLLSVNQYIYVNTETNDIEFVGKPNTFPYAIQLYKTILRMFLMEGVSFEKCKQYLSRTLGQMECETDMSLFCFKQTLHRPLSSYKSTNMDICQAALKLQIRENRFVHPGEIIPCYYCFPNTVEPILDHSSKLDYSRYKCKILNFFEILEDSINKRTTRTIMMKQNEQNDHSTKSKSQTNPEEVADHSSKPKKTKRRNDIFTYID